MIARKKARKVQEKKPRQNMFPSDAEGVELRRKSAAVQAAKMIDLETLFGESASAMPPSEVLHLDRAREHWKTAARAVKAAKAPDETTSAAFEGEAYGANAALAQALYEVALEKNVAGEFSADVIGLYDQVDKLLLEMSVVC